MTRLKLGYWDSVITDCEACLTLTPESMKAHYYLAQAQLNLRDFDAALSSALRAHGLCAKTNDRSLAAVTALVLKAKSDRWEDRERKRKRETADLEREVLGMLGRERDEALMETDSEMIRKEIEEESEGKIMRMKNIFEAARSNSEKKREVPEWAVDDISFGIMVDPVIVRFPPFPTTTAIVH